MNQDDISRVIYVLEEVMKGEIPFVVPVGSIRRVIRHLRELNVPDF